jgi:hypothetical protein
MGVAPVARLNNGNVVTVDRFDKGRMAHENLHVPILGGSGLRSMLEVGA